MTSTQGEENKAMAEPVGEVKGAEEPSKTAEKPLRSESDDKKAAEQKQEADTDKTAATDQDDSFLPRKKRELVYSGDKEKLVKIAMEDEKEGDSRKDLGGARLSRRATIKAHILNAVKQPMPGSGHRPQTRMSETGPAMVKDAEMETSKDPDFAKKKLSAAPQASEASSKSVRSQGLAVFRTIKDKVWEFNEPSEYKKEAARAERKQELKIKENDEGQTGQTEASSRKQGNESKRISETKPVDKPVPAVPEKSPAPHQKRRWSTLATDVVKSLFVMPPPPSDSRPALNKTQGPKESGQAALEKAKSTVEQTAAQEKGDKESKETKWTKRATQLFHDLPFLSSTTGKPLEAEKDHPKENVGGKSVSKKPKESETVDAKAAEATDVDLQKDKLAESTEVEGKATAKIPEPVAKDDEQPSTTAAKTDT